ncbi:MAG TPA: hypothetical protein VIM63_09185 [Rhodoferax sp.]
MNRRHLLLAFPIWLSASAQNLDLPQVSPVDAVNVYIIPTDDISEEAAGGIARALNKEPGLWIKSTLWTPSEGMEPFTGTNQYPAEDYFPMGARAARMLREVSPRTYYIVLTNRDINSKSRNFRFQYSSHSPMANTSVLSITRLMYTSAGAPVANEVVDKRVTKMLLRIVGEMRMGWKRTSDPADLMYAPIMSIDDVDRMSLSHTLQSRKQSQ